MNYVTFSDAGVMSAPTPLVIGAAKGCDGFQGFFDEVGASLNMLISNTM